MCCPVLNQVVVSKPESLPRESKPVLAKTGHLAAAPAGGEGQPQVEPEFLVLGEHEVKEPGRLLGGRWVWFALALRGGRAFLATLRSVHS